MHLECVQSFQEQMELASCVENMYDMHLENQSKKDLESTFQYIVEGLVCCNC